MSLNNVTLTFHYSCTFIKHKELLNTPFTLQKVLSIKMRYISVFENNTMHNRKHTFTLIKPLNVSTVVRNIFDNFLLLWYLVWSCEDLYLHWLNAKWMKNCLTLTWSYQMYFQFYQKNVYLIHFTIKGVNRSIFITFFLCDFVF